MDSPQIIIITSFICLFLKQCETNTQSTDFENSTQSTSSENSIFELKKSVTTDSVYDATDTNSIIKKSDIHKNVLEKFKKRDNSGASVTENSLTKSTNTETSDRPEPLNCRNGKCYLKTDEEKLIIEPRGTTDFLTISNSGSKKCVLRSLTIKSQINIDPKIVNHCKNLTYLKLEGNVF